MIKSGIKNYFVNLKHFFTPIGTLAVGMFIGISILIPGSISILGALIERFKEIIQDASLDIESVKNYLADTIRALDWSDPIASLKTMLNREWIVNVLNGCLNVVASDLQPYTDAINEAVASAIAGIYMLFVLFILLSVAGLVCGYFLTRFLVRRNMAKRTFKKFILAALVDSIVTAGLISLCFWLLTLWAPSIFITAVLSLFIFGGVALVSAYLVHGNKKIPFKTVFNFANMFKLLLVNFIVFVISFAFLIITVALTNEIAGLLIGFSFVEIAFLVISMNAENYVINLLPAPEKAEEQTLPSAA